MEDITSLSVRDRSIKNFKKKLVKKGSGEKGFDGYDDKAAFNEVVAWD